MYDILARGIHQPDWLWLTRTLAFPDPTQDDRFRARRCDSPGPGQPDYPVASHKSSFGKGNRCGLPIGNPTSQFRGNVYLNELDRFIKDVGGTRSGSAMTQLTLADRLSGIRPT